MNTSVTINSQPKVLGFTDSICNCDRCGKTDLRGTYCIETSDGQLIYLGSICIGHMMEYSVKETNSFIKAELKERMKEKKNEIKLATQEIENKMSKIRDNWNDLNNPVWADEQYKILWDELIQITNTIEAKYKKNDVK